MTEPITVIIPTYNKADYISQTIESVLNQTYLNYEIVIIDDCSIDDTRNVVEKYLADNVRYFKHDTNWGPGATFNDGIGKSNSEYITIIASDDTLLPNHLELIMQEFKKNSLIETVFPRVKTVDENGKNLHSIVEQKFTDKYKLLNYLFYVGNAMPSPGIAFNKSLFRKTPAFNSALIQLHDYDLNVRALMYGKTSVVPVPTVLYRRFLEPTVNLSANVRWLNTCHLIETKIVLDNFLNMNYKDIVNVFPQLHKYNEAEIKFRLLVDTCKNRQYRLSSWAFERLIYYIETDDSIFKNNKFNFQYKDYINLYRLNAQNLIGRSHKERLYYNLTRVIRRLFGLE